MIVVPVAPVFYFGAVAPNTICPNGKNCVILQQLQTN